MGAVRVQHVTTPQELEDFRSMTRSYLEWLGEDLDYQGVEAELAGLPGVFAEDAGGCMLLALESMDESMGASTDEREDASAAATAEAAGRGAPPAAACAAVGAVALRALGGFSSSSEVGGVALERCCEMKRLFVLPEKQGQGVGRALVQVRAGVGDGLEAVWNQ